jgi:hypothetical protein
MIKYWSITVLLIGCHFVFSMENTGGSYFGQALPGSVPKLLAPDIFSNTTGYHSAVSFNHNLSIAVWSEMRTNHNMMISYFIDGSWTSPQNLDFGFEEGVGDAVFRSRSSELYFLANRNSEGQVSPREFIWTTSFKNGQWDAPSLLPEAITQYQTHWNCSVATSGNIYFTVESSTEPLQQNIYFCEKKEGGYLDPVHLNSLLNTPGIKLTPCISADESYLLFSSRNLNHADMDIYISFKDDLGEWLPARRLEEPINSDRHDLGPILSPDEQVMFFISQRNGKSSIFWVNTSSFVHR